MYAIRSYYEPVTLCDQAITLGAQLHLFKPAQAAQAHVQDRLGLRLGQMRDRPILGLPRLGDQRLLRLILEADDLDHPIKVEIGDDVAAKDFEPVRDLLEPVITSYSIHYTKLYEC